MASLADVDAVFFEAQQAALNGDDHILLRLMPRLRSKIGECIDIPSITHRQQLGGVVDGHIDQLRKHAPGGRIISISELV